MKDVEAEHGGSKDQKLGYLVVRRLLRGKTKAARSQALVRPSRGDFFECDSEVSLAVLVVRRLLKLGTTAAEWKKKLRSPHCESCRGGGRRQQGRKA